MVCILIMHQNRLKWQRPLRNWKNWTGLTTFTQIPPFREKIVKIGPVDPEIALLNLKKKEITKGKIYSPVGNLVERAKLSLIQSARL